MVGHVEWVQFVRVVGLPSPGEIVHASQWWEEPAGGGPVSAAQLRRLGSDTLFFTALGDDELGHRAYDELSSMGIEVHAAFRPEPTRRAITFVDETGERTITVLGARLAPRGADGLPWDLLTAADCAYFTAGDGGALRAARRVGVLVATARVIDVLATESVQLDALVGSASDRGEQFARDDISPPPHLCVWTESEAGGRFAVEEGPMQRYAPIAPAGPIVDRYGAGDAFAAGLTWGLGSGLSVTDALELAARCGTATVGGRGPYEGQMRDPT